MKKQISIYNWEAIFPGLMGQTPLLRPGFQVQKRYFVGCRFHVRVSCVWGGLSRRFGDAFGEVFRLSCGFSDRVYRSR